MIDRLRALEEKYLHLTQLSERREAVQAAGEAFSPAELGRRRDAFRRLSAAFPGALRELEELPRARLEARRSVVSEELAQVAAGGTIRRRWVKVVLDFHQILSDLLAAKLWLARRVGQSVEIADEIAAERPSLSRGELEAVRRPPGGRILALVWAELERRHGLSRAQLEHLVFFAVDE
jgi:hypothetical protein